jgi:hypothetical protein
MLVQLSAGFTLRYFGRPQCTQAPQQEINAERDRSWRRRGSNGRFVLTYKDSQVVRPAADDWSRANSPQRRGGAHFLFGDHTGKTVNATPLRGI